MARTRPAGAARARRAGIELSIRLDLPGGAGHIGPGKIELLRLIGEHRSIAAAARAMNMSYRRAWLLVQELNGLFAQPLVDKWLGGRSHGGATLTPTGERVIAAYETVVRESRRANRLPLGELLRSIQRSA
jgi:molybdate transport system regulatory protein